MQVEKHQMQVKPNLFFFSLGKKFNDILNAYFAEFQNKLHVAPHTHVAFKGELLPYFNSSCPKFPSQNEWVK